MGEMTKKQATRWLKDLLKSDLPMEQYQIALEKGIEALEQEPCDDAISRQATIDGINRYFHDEYYQRTSIQDCRDCLIEDVIKKLSSVNPQSKTGHWILSDDGLYRPICDKCGAHPWKGYIPTVEEATKVFKYCPSCGAKMIEPQERSDKE